MFILLSLNNLLYETPGKLSCFEHFIILYWSNTYLKKFLCNVFRRTIDTQRNPTRYHSFQKDEEMNMSHSGVLQSHKKILRYMIHQRHVIVTAPLMDNCFTSCSVRISFLDVCFCVLMVVAADSFLGFKGKRWTFFSLSSLSLLILRTHSKYGIQLGYLGW